MTSYTSIINLSTTSPLLRWLFSFALCFEVFLPFDLLGQYFLFLTTMPFFHGATEFLHKKLWFIILKCLVLYFFFFPVQIVIDLLPSAAYSQSSVNPPSLVSLVDFLYLKKKNYSSTLSFPSGSAIKNPSAMQDTRVPSLGQEDLLEKEIATHFDILAGEISETKEPGGLQSMRFQRSQKQLSN